MTAKTTTDVMAKLAALKAKRAAAPALLVLSEVAASTRAPASASASASASVPIEDEKKKSAIEEDAEVQLSYQEYARKFAEQRAKKMQSESDAKRAKEDADMKAGIFDRKEDAPAPLKPKLVDEDRRNKFAEEVAYARAVARAFLDQKEVAKGIEAIVVDVVTLHAFGRKVPVLVSPMDRHGAIRLTDLQLLFGGSSTSAFAHAHLVSSFDDYDEVRQVMDRMDNSSLQDGVNAALKAETKTDFDDAANSVKKFLLVIKEVASHALVSLERLHVILKRKRFNIATLGHSGLGGLSIPDVLYGATGKLAKNGEDKRHSEPERRSETRSFSFQVEALCEAFNLVSALYYCSRIERTKGPLPASAKPFGGACDPWPAMNGPDAFAAIASHYNKRMAGHKQKDEQKNTRAKKKNVSDEVANDVNDIPDAKAEEPKKKAKKKPTAAAAAAAADVDADGDAKMKESKEEPKAKPKPKAKAKSEAKPEAKPKAKPNAKPKAKPKAKPVEANGEEDGAAENDETLLRLQNEIFSRMMSCAVPEDIATEMVKEITTVDDAREWIKEDRANCEEENGEAESDDDDAQEAVAAEKPKSSGSGRKRKQIADEEDAESHVSDLIKEAEDKKASASASAAAKGLNGTEPGDDDDKKDSAPAAKRVKRIQSTPSQEENKKSDASPMDASEPIDLTISESQKPDEKDLRPAQPSSVVPESRPMEVDSSTDIPLQLNSQAEDVVGLAE